MQNSVRKQTMYEMAKELDMPSAFVDMRHECTHGDVPSVQRLHRHTLDALDWLWRFYWSELENAAGTDGAKEEEEEDDDIQDNKNTGGEMRETDKGTMRASLKTILIERRAALKAGRTGSHAARQACREFVGICRLVPDGVQFAVAILLDERTIIPSDKTCVLIFPASEVPP